MLMRLFRIHRAVLWHADGGKGVKGAVTVVLLEKGKEPVATVAGPRRCASPYPQRTADGDPGLRVL